MTNSQDGQPFTVSSKSFTAVAISTAAKAGEWIQSKLGAYASLNTKAAPQDLVTEVDKGSEKLIRNLLQTHFPHHDYLGEEGVEPGAEASARAIAEKEHSEYLWIIDPIDGTTNFVHGFPFYSVSIGLAHRGELIVGVVYDPSRDEIFVAEKGKGAYLRGRRTGVSQELRLADSLIATGFPASKPEALAANLRGLQALTPKVRSMRASGSAALHLAYVAAGRLSGYYELGLSAWDVAAGVLLVTESGGKVTDTNGRPYTLTTRNILATNGRIHQELAEQLAAAGAAEA